MTKQCCNRILAQLPQPVRDSLPSFARVVTLSADTELPLFDYAGNFTYFPETAVLSLSHVLADSAYTEVLSVGNEGVLAPPGQPGMHSQSQLVALVQLAGTAWRIPQSVLRLLAEQYSELRRLLVTHTDLTMQQLYQIAACYRHHSIAQQLSRLLLSHDDRFPQQPITTTHAKLARRLGVRREAISTVAGALQKCGALQYHRGVVTHIDRDRLLLYSCECYYALHAIEQKKAQQTSRA